ncbi:MAG TPA: antitoxin family protein [Phycisphaerae bacterium]|nr:antitoxin family protein [Phycisphaerae bacterium]
MTIKAIYENGVFRPIDAVSFPEHTEVEFEPRLAHPPLNTSPEGMDQIYALLMQTFDDPSSPGNLAERHNEHQP